jgi:hypothetical protein
MTGFTITLLRHGVGALAGQHTLRPLPNLMVMGARNRLLPPKGRWLCEPLWVGARSLRRLQLLSGYFGMPCAASQALISVLGHSEPRLGRSTRFGKVLALTPS